MADNKPRSFNLLQLKGGSVFFGPGKDHLAAVTLAEN